MSKFNLPLLTSSNWSSWKPQFVGVLEYKGWDEALTDDEHEDQKRALGLLKQHLDSSMLNVIQGHNTCRAAWEALTALFSVTATAQALKLKQDLTNLSMKPKEGVTEYFSRGRVLQLELETAGYDISDEELVLHLLKGLTAEFETIKTVLIASDETTYATVLSRLLNAEAANKQTASSAAFYMNKPPGHRSGGPSYNQHHNHNHTPGGGGEQQHKKGMRCHYCKKKGHLKRECYKRKADMARQQGSNGQQHNTPPRGGGVRGPTGLPSWWLHPLTHHTWTRELASTSPLMAQPCLTWSCWLHRSA